MFSDSLQSKGWIKERQLLIRDVWGLFNKIGTDSHFLKSILPLCYIFNTVFGVCNGIYCNRLRIENFGEDPAN